MVSNEGKVCDAVLRLLEERTGRVRANVRNPEKDHIGPPVDLAFDLGDQQYAFEHTIIEAYPEQIPMGMHFKTLIDPVVKALDGKLPKPGVYSLAAPLSVHLGDKKLLKAAQAAIIKWVQEMAAELHAEAPVRRDRHYDPYGRRGTRTQQPAGLPFKLTLSRRVHWRESGKHDGRLFVARFAPPDEYVIRLFEDPALVGGPRCGKGTAVAPLFPSAALSTHRRRTARSSHSLLSDHPAGNTPVRGGSRTISLCDLPPVHLKRGRAIAFGG